MVFCVFHALAFVQTEVLTARICRRETSRALNEIKFSFEKLFSLNSSAELLRTRWLALEAQIIAAEALLPESLPALTILLQQKAVLLIQRQQLDHTQKFILNSIDLQSLNFRSQISLALKSYKSSGVLNYKLSNLQIYTLQSGIAFPDIPDIAPVYGLHPQWNQKAYVSVSWNERQTSEDSWISGNLEKLEWNSGCSFALGAKPIGLVPQLQVVARALSRDRLLLRR